MSNAILICTNNLVPKTLFKKVLMNAFTQADMVGDTSVIVVSHYPVFENFFKADFFDDKYKESKREEHKAFEDVILKEPFFNPEDMFNSGYVNCVVGEREYSQATIYSQMLLGSDYGEDIIIMEHDVLYPLNYVKTVSGVLGSGLQACYWANGKFFSEKGFFDVSNIMTLSRFALKNNVFKKIYKNKLKNNLNFVEPVFKGLPAYGDSSTEVVVSRFAMVYGIDTLDIRHGLNVSGNLIVDNYEFKHEYWGDYMEIVSLIDDNCKTFVADHPSCNYGIFI